MIYLLVDNTTGFMGFIYDIIFLLEALDHVGLAIYTFVEVLLILPPIEVIYYPLVQLNTDTWYLYLLNVVFFNVLASGFGYFIGMKFGYPVLRFMASEENLEKAQNLFKKWGILAVALGAFTPVPYTIVVFLAGISKMNFKKFMIAGFVGRFPRYVLGGYLLVYIVDGINSEVLNEYMLIMSIVGMLLVMLYYVFQTFYNVYKRSQQA
jgi:membrane protein YqaA with SNARE-associated domain